MGHNGDVATTLLTSTAQELDELIGIAVGSETLRPECQTARSDTEILEMRKEVRIAEWLKILGQRFRFHNHGVSSSHENIRNLRVFSDVVEERPASFCAKRNSSSPIN
jgi:hypothetical protein